MPSIYPFPVYRFLLPSPRWWLEMTSHPSSCWTAAGEEFGAFVRREIAQWREVARAANVRLEG